ncbi:MAG: EamA family transporter RarD [Acidimicrobiales bacterium]|nr:EamA family transporter RarD [Acidimicrobiales bacterium]
MQRGFFYAVGAFSLWGVSPAFWRLLRHVPSADIFGHRVVWTFGCVALILVSRRSWRRVAEAVGDRRILRLEFVAAVLLGSNWLLWVWAVTSDHVIEGSLGYFMNPLVSVVLGMLFLGESLRPPQWVAVGLAVVGVVWLTVQVGTLPWIALVLAFTFGFYGLIKKKLDLSPFEGLGIEMSVLLLPAMLFLVVRAASGDGAMGVGVPGDSLLLMAGGLFTAGPLLLFGAAVRRVPLTVIGLTQYLAPTINFVLGVAVYDEPFDGMRLIGFAAIWAGLIVFSQDFIRSARRMRLVG